MNKPVLLALNGWGMDDFAWNGLMRGLNNLFTCSTVSWKGLHNVSGISKYVTEAFNNIGDEVFYLAGWSLGSIAALEASLSFPGRIKGLILFGASPCFASRPGEYACGWPVRVLERMKKRLIENPEETLSNFHSMMFSGSEKKDGYYFRWTRAQNPGFNGDTAESLAAGLDYLIETDLRGRLGKIKEPVLLIHGTDDIICPPAASEYLRNSLGGSCRLDILPGCGHAPVYTRFEESLKIIGEFYAENNCR
jgi:pimeloyl-[acyl-carrier protein] methyl ester esterase